MIRVIIFIGTFIPGRMLTIVNRIHPAIKCAAIFKTVLLMSHINLNVIEAIIIKIINNIISVIIK
jgi:hypothetical protein